MPKLSVIVPAYNSQSTLDLCLSAIKKSTHKNYELIVVNDGSTDQTFAIARKFTNHIISFPRNKGKQTARKAGIAKSRGQIIVNIDSDVIIKPDSLQIISGYFHQHPNISAVTGLLEWDNPFPNFPTLYKNLYMNFYFSQLPRKITFLYGSIFAVKKASLKQLSFPRHLKNSEDSEIGQQLIKQAQEIHLIKSLKVIHIKTYTLKTLLINDFMVPYDWAQIFILHQGWNQIGKYRTGYMHASKTQIVSLFLVPMITIFIALSFLYTCSMFFTIFILSIWIITNYRFFKFLCQKKGLLFTLRSISLTFFDHLIMAIGIFCGTLNIYRKLLFNRH